MQFVSEKVNKKLSKRVTLIPSILLTGKMIEAEALLSLKYSSSRSQSYLNIGKSFLLLFLQFLNIDMYFTFLLRDFVIHLFIIYHVFFESPTVSTKNDYCEIEEVAKRFFMLRIILSKQLID